jgi:predicted acylesterase/phospholipase RssA
VTTFSKKSVVSEWTQRFNRIAVVDGSGGAKEAYHLGRDVALDGLGISPDAELGASDGALYGLLKTYKNLNEIRAFYNNLSIGRFLGHPELPEKMGYFGLVKWVARILKKSGRPSTEDVVADFRRDIDVAKIAVSDKEFGMVLMSKPWTLASWLSGSYHNSAEEFWLDDMKNGDVMKYIAAAMTIPMVMKPVEIDGRELHDPSYPNGIDMPLYMAIEKGCDLIICSSLDYGGWSQRQRDVQIRDALTCGCTVIFIAYGNPTNQPFFDFRAELNPAKEKAGFDDTMKVFDRIADDVAAGKVGKFYSNNPKAEKKIRGTV